MQKGLFFSMATILLFSSCVTRNGMKNYRLFNTFEAEGSRYYYYGNRDADSLIVYIDGSGLSSVLGESRGDKFVSYSFAYPLSEYFCVTDSILIPEKPGMAFGGIYNSDMNVVRQYTVDCLVAAYVNSIDSHLYRNPYRKVCIIGVSEGGLLLPKIYADLEHKNSVSHLVVMGAGGLGQYECFQIQYDNYPALHEDYRNQLAGLQDVRKLIDETPHSIEEGYLGWPYSRWSSFFAYEPGGYIEKISIPLLYLQGKEDQSSPIESVEAIEEMALPNISIEYIDAMGHTPSINNQINFVLGLIDKWRSEN